MRCKTKIPTGLAPLDKSSAAVPTLLVQYVWGRILEIGKSIFQERVCLKHILNIPLKNEKTIFPFHKIENGKIAFFVLIRLFKKSKQTN